MVVKPPPRAGAATALFFNVELADFAFLVDQMSNSMVMDSESEHPGCSR